MNRCHFRPSAIASVEPDEAVMVGPIEAVIATLTFSFADIEGSVAMVQRLGDAWARVAAVHHFLIRAGRAAHGG